MVFVPYDKDTREGNGLIEMACCEGCILLFRFIKAERAKRARLRYLGSKGGQFVVVCYATPPTWMDGSDHGVTSTSPPTGVDQSGPNFQGVIRSWERSSSNI